MLRMGRAVKWRSFIGPNWYLKMNSIGVLHCYVSGKIGNKMVFVDV